MKVQLKSVRRIPVQSLSGIGLISFNLLRAFVRQGLAALIPVVIILLLLAAILFFINLSAPLAPFVYSLF